MCETCGTCGLNSVGRCMKCKMPLCERHALIGRHPYGTSANPLRESNPSEAAFLKGYRRDSDILLCDGCRAEAGKAEQLKLAKLPLRGQDPFDRAVTLIIRGYFHHGIGRTIDIDTIIASWIREADRNRIKPSSGYTDFRSRPRRKIVAWKFPKSCESRTDNMTGMDSIPDVYISPAGDIVGLEPNKDRLLKEMARLLADARKIPWEGDY